MDGKPGRPLPAVFGHDENRVAGKRYRLTPDFHDADIHPVLGPDQDFIVPGAEAGEYQFIKDFRGDFPDFRHFAHCCFSFTVFFKNKKPEAEKVGLLALTSLPYARIIEFRFKGYVPMLRDSQPSSSPSGNIQFCYILYHRGLSFQAVLLPVSRSTRFHLLCVLQGSLKLCPILLPAAAPPARSG